MAARSRHTALAVLLTLLLLVVAGCPREPYIRFAEGEENGGMRPIEPVPFQKAWAREGIDFSRYDKILARFAGIFYREPPREFHTRFHRSSNYPMPRGMNESLMNGLAEIFDESIWYSKALRPTRRPGPSVLLAKIAVIDLVLTAPLGHAAADDPFWVDSVGTFTLVIDLYDSESGRLVARAAERRMISTGRSTPIRATVGDTTYHSRRIFRDWAEKLTELLTGLREMPLAGPQQRASLQLARPSADH